VSKNRVIIGVTEKTIDLISRIKALGFSSILIDMHHMPEADIDGLTIYTLDNVSDDGDLVITESIDVNCPENAILKIKIEKKDDEKKVLEAAQKGFHGVLIEPEGWRIIPLENIIALLNKYKTRIFSIARSLDDMPMLLEVMEKGVNKIIIYPKNRNELDKLRQFLREIQFFEMSVAEILEVRSLPAGERVCVDTATMMELGEGMLVGAMSNFYFLVHSEVISSEFSAPRPFSVNAGAVSNYILMADGKTKYLSEIKCGDEVLIVNKNGKGRIAVVGRAKIEKRPLCVVRAKYGTLTGAILLQEAETIRLLKADGTPVSVTELNAGDKVLIYAIKERKGRHFGMEVNEFIIEK